MPGKREKVRHINSIINVFEPFDFPLLLFLRTSRPPAKKEDWKDNKSAMWWPRSPISPTGQGRVDITNDARASNVL